MLLDKVIKNKHPNGGRWLSTCPEVVFRVIIPLDAFSEELTQNALCHCTKKSKPEAQK